MAFPAAFADWQYRAPLTYDNAYVGSGGVTNFPYLVPWTTAPAGLFTNANADGSDLRLTTTDGETEVNFELVSFTPGSSLMEFWGLGASVASAADTNLGYIYWGNAAASGKAAAWGQGVWDSNFVTVCHCHDAASPATDSTANGNNGVQSGGVTFGSAGQVGNACYFDGVDNYLLYGDLDVNSFTAEAWVKPAITYNAALPDSWYDIISKEVEASSGFKIAYATWSGNVHCRLLGVDTYNASFTTELTANTWYQIAGAFTNTGHNKLYLNGTLKDTDAGTPTMVQNNLGLRIADSADGRWKEFNATIDEFRLSNIERSGAWMLTGYNNQLTPALTVLWGDVESNTAAGAWRMRRWNPFILPGANPGFMLLPGGL